MALTVPKYVLLTARVAIDSVEIVTLDVSLGGEGHYVKILVGIIILTDVKHYA